jgi:SAM-dependent methyltransferase
MIDRLRDTARRWRTRLAMRAALRSRPLWRWISRDYGQRWGQRAPGWDTMVAAHEHKWFLPLDAALAPLPSGFAPRRVVDIGGGTGRTGFHVAARYPDATVMVVDLAPGMVKYGQARMERERLPAVGFVVGDSTALPLLAGVADLVYVMNAPANVDEMRRVLRPGGVAALAFTYGHHTPMYLPGAVVERALRGAGFVGIMSGVGGEGTYTIGRLPGANGQR